MELGLENKVALITGGGGTIGTAIAVALAEEGCIVYLGDSNAEAAAHAASLVGARGHALEMDVRNFEDLVFKTQRIVHEQGRIDILVNGAGILKTGSVMETSVTDWDHVCKVNLSGVFYCSKAVMPGMVAQRSGRIVNIASISAFRGGGIFGNVIYGTTKAGVVAMTKGFARELAPFGINVNAIAPGMADTEMTHALLTPEKQRAVAGAIPAGRLATPEDIAKIAVVLASDASQYVTGETILVDGGYLTK